jgi:DNA-binding CsgD family transcriptional regulator
VVAAGYSLSEIVDNLGCSNKTVIAVNKEMADL